MLQYIYVSLHPTAFAHHLNNYVVFIFEAKANSFHKKRYYIKNNDAAAKIIDQSCAKETWFIVCWVSYVVFRFDFNTKTQD